jgi:UDP-N-acetylmuramate dehydrogenase
MPVFRGGRVALAEFVSKLAMGVRELRRSADVEIHERVDLRAWTALGVGGVATMVARCRSASGVLATLDLASSHGLAWLTLGGGSRIITPDGGIVVPVLSLTGELARWESDLGGIVAGGGANLAQVCRAAVRNGLIGLDAAGSDSGTVGGLVVAGAAGVVDLAGTIDWVELQRPGAAVERWRATDDRPVPRIDELHRRVVVRARFRLRPWAGLEPRPRTELPRPSRAVRATGPVFLDPLDATAADLLAEAGCSGMTVGGARLGGEGSNELVAGRSATSADVLSLCRRGRDRVAEVTGVTLNPALVFVDEWGREIAL